MKFFMLYFLLLFAACGEPQAYNDKTLDEQTDVDEESYEDSRVDSTFQYESLRAIENSEDVEITLPASCGNINRGALCNSGTGSVVLVQSSLCGIDMFRLPDHFFGAMCDR